MLCVCYCFHIGRAQGWRHVKLVLRGTSRRLPPTVPRPEPPPSPVPARSVLRASTRKLKAQLPASSAPLAAPLTPRSGTGSPTSTSRATTVPSVLASQSFDHRNILRGSERCDWFSPTFNRARICINNDLLSPRNRYGRKIRPQRWARRVPAGGARGLRPRRDCHRHRGL